MSDAPQILPRVLIIGQDQVEGQAEVDSGLVAWQSALASFSPVAVRGREAALVELEREPFALVIADFRAFRGGGLEILQARAKKFPQARQILLADYAELPEILRTRIHESAIHVAPRSGNPENLFTLVERTLARDPNASALEAEAIEVLDWPEAVKLLRWTLLQAVRIPGVVIRPLGNFSERLELQFVIPIEIDFEPFHCRLPARWGWPILSRPGQGFSRKRKDHPGVRAFGDVQDNQELFVQEVGERDGIHLALLPWQTEDRLTMVIGVWGASDSAQREKHIEVLKELHAFATREVLEFVLTKRPAGPDKKAYHSLRYDWVVSKQYVGPDRRKNDTSLLNRFVIFGKRKQVAPELSRRSGGFVDRFPRWAFAYLLAFLFLSSIDTAFTSWFVGNGTFRELNPILRPLVAHRPWAFLLTKNSFAIAALFLVLRLHLFRIARYLLPGTLLGYLALDLYWFWLIWIRKVAG